MTDHTECPVPPGLADQTLEVRRARDTVVDREIQDGLSSRHLAIARDQGALAVANFATLVRVAPALAAKVRGD